MADGKLQFHISDFRLEQISDSVGAVFVGQGGEGFGEVGEEIAFGAVVADADGLRVDAEGKETVGEPLLVDGGIAFVGVGPGTARKGE